MKVVKDENKKTHWISFRVDEKTWKSLQRAMKKSNMTRAELARTGLRHILEFYNN